MCKILLGLGFEASLPLPAPCEQAFSSKLRPRPDHDNGATYFVWKSFWNLLMWKKKNDFRTKSRSKNCNARKELFFAGDISRKWEPPGNHTAVIFENLQNPSSCDKHVVKCSFPILYCCRVACFFFFFFHTSGLCSFHTSGPVLWKHLKILVIKNRTKRGQLINY